MSQLHELLHASLVGPELLRLMRLLADQHQTGDLYVRDERCSGAVAFDHGRVRSAVVGELAGLPALELLVSASAPVEVAFLENAAPVAPNVPIDGAPLWAHLAELKPPDATDELLPTTIPYPSGLESEDTAELEVAPDVVATLLLVDGQRTAWEIAAERRLSRTRHELVQLEQLGLVTWVGDAQTFVPRKSERPDASEVMPLIVDRSMLATLSHVDGYSTIKAIAAARRLRRTTDELRALERLGLITFVPPSTPSNQLPPPNSRQRTESTEEPPPTSWVPVEPPPVWGQPHPRLGHGRVGSRPRS